jgi:predicted dehydrogenase
MTTGPIRMAMIGYGWIAAMHVRAAQALGDQVVDVVAVAGHDGDRAQAFADAHGITVATDEVDALLTDSDVDLVVIGTPNALHAAEAIRALDDGKHVLVEKPMAIDLAQADAMIDAARRADRVLAVGHMWRYRDEVVALRDRIARDELGRIVRTHGHGVHAGWGPTGWFVDPALAGGGALIDMGIHAIDTARFLLGDPHPVRVQASIGRGEFGDYAVDDDGIVVVDWDQGTRSLVEFGWWQPRLGGLEAETEVLGTSGAARIWPDRPPVEPGYEHCSVPMYAAQLADVVRCCRDGGTPLASAEVGRTALAIVEAAYASASRSGT